MKLDKKRRRENRTNYKKRLDLLKKGYKRLVVRKTNKYIILQIIESKHAQDKILYTVNTKELLRHGWPKENAGSLKSLAAAYIAGKLLGKKVKDIKGRVILDIGLNPSTKKSRIYAVLKGLSDSGINIPFDESIVPDDEKIFENNKVEKKMLEKISGGLK